MSERTIEALAWSLLHFVWQGTAIALLAGAGGAVLRKARPSTRHAVYVGALMLMLLAPSITFLTLRGERNEPAPLFAATSFAPPIAAFAAMTPRAGVVGASPAALVTWLPWIVRFWLAGVAILSLRALGGFLLAQRLKRWKTLPAAGSLQRAAAELGARLGVRRPVEILASAAARVPLAVGWLRPVVLLPVCVLTALTPDQIEMVLAHELAHIRRLDYLVNLAQTAIETVLFYHPAVWWLSGRIRAEREHSCDDLAIEACGNAVGYARALATLEGIAGRESALVVAANGGSLLGRVQRLLGREGRAPSSSPAWLVAVLPIVLTLAAVGTGAAPPAADPVAPDPPAKIEGFLGGLAAAGYTHISVDDIIALKDHGVEPEYIKAMLAAGLGALDVRQLIELRTHGVEPEFVAELAASGLVGDLDVGNAVRLRENGVDGGDLARIRALGFGPFRTDGVIRLRQNGVDADSFETLAEIGLRHAGVEDAVQVRQNDVTVERIREMRKQGFHDLTLEQIVKLRRAGII